MVFTGAVLEAEAENGMIEGGVFEETDDFHGVEVAHDQDNREPSSHGRGRRWKAVVRTRAAKQGLLGGLPAGKGFGTAVKAGMTLFHDKGSDMDHLLDIFKAEGDTLFLELRGAESGLECEL